MRDSRVAHSRQPNAVNGTPDYGHIRDVELLTGDRPIDPQRDDVTDGLRRAMRSRIRMWSLGAHRAELAELIE